MSRVRICLLTMAAVTVPVSTWSQDLIFSSDVGDELIDDAKFDFQNVLERLGDLQEESPLLSGDANGDGTVNLVDPIYLLNWIFQEGPEPVPLSCSLPTEKALDGPDPFVGVGIRLEFNETDGDGEVTLVAESKEGLRSLTVHDPSNRKIADLRSPGGRELGLEKIVLQSSDPTLEGVTGAYPEGAYLFQAVTTSGTHLAGEAELTHEVLPAPGFVHRVNQDSLDIEWAPVDDATGYTLELGQADLGFKLKVKLDPTIRFYSVPVTLLVAGEDYDLSIATVTGDGNLVVAETEVAIPSSSAPVEKHAEGDEDE